MKATHSGECQLCGRQQKLPSGHLSLHGYAVKWSTFIGTCPGSKHLPYELSCDLLAPRIEQETKIIEALVASAAAARAETEFVWLHEYTYDKNRGRGTYAWRKLPTTEVTFGFRTRWTGADGRTREVSMYQPHDSADGYRDELNEKRAVAYALIASQHADYQAWLIKRVADWRPRELTPVTEAA